MKDKIFHKVEDRLLAAALKDAGFQRPVPMTIACRFMNRASLDDRLPKYGKGGRFAKLAASFALCAALSALASWQAAVRTAAVSTQSADDETVGSVAYDIYGRHEVSADMSSPEPQALVCEVSASAVPENGEGECGPCDKAVAKLSATAPTASSLVAIDTTAYVQEGLVLHYDGISNAGADKPHDYSAAVWKDLSPTGNDAEFIGNGNDQGGWLADGYEFSSNGVFQTAARQDFGTSFTVQIVAYGDNYSHKSDTWPWFVGCNTTWWSLYLSGSSTASLNADMITGLNWETRAGLVGWSGRYLTAVTDGRDTALFEGTAPLAYAIGSAGSAKKDSLGNQFWAVGGPPTNGLAAAYRAVRLQNTPVHSVRVYNRVLTEEEMERNRFVDDARFFGEVPPTNAVVVSAHPSGVEGRERAGVYMADGWTFSAAAATFGNKDYVPTGYSIERWDADEGLWVAEDGSDSAAEWTSPSGGEWPSRRLSWKWRVVRGVYAASDYDVGDYVQDGLVLHYDAIRNNGAMRPHVASATTWKDLSPSRNDAVFSGNGNAAAGGWATLDGGAACYRFASNGVFDVSRRQDFGVSFTVQLVSGGYDAYDYERTYPLYLCNHTGWYQLGLTYNGGDVVVQLAADAVTGLKWDSRAMLRGWGGPFLTAVLSGRDSAVFDGTASPLFVPGNADAATKDSLGGQFYALGGAPTRYEDATYRAKRFLTGTLGAVRVYNRMLSDEELARNRMVDMARYEGRMSVTNVVLSYGKYDWCDSGMAERPGEYAVQGTWTFKAFDTRDDQGKTRKISGWKLRAWNEATGAWGGVVSGKGGSYTYVVGESPAKVLLEWDWVPPPFMMVVR